ncbi:MAG: FmdB family transcriptional regulator [Ilumatobacter coccineus]|uniref:FmdB family transcriptional regulator n=1 Tax=Ilumatobacter coccineus TaxID=467094 RepID=A0A2G6K6U3_9ACTN|nr:MAG: FmdB family transcriptional regulator [Ilumatobacter coccineus]
MPTYLYRFIDTNEEIEVRQSFSDDTLTEYPHPDTGQMMAVKKVFLPVGVTFKGNGFYKTDNRASSSATKPAPASSSSTSSTSTTSSESTKATSSSASSSTSSSSD